MLRAAFYLALSAALWAVEGFLFSRYLGFSVWQTALTAVFYVFLFGIALALLLRALRAPAHSEAGLAAWRLLSVAPMLVVIIGSFLSLPVMLLVLALGNVGS